MVDFSGQKALFHARSLSFPRKTGGPGWHKSRDYILAEFQKLGYPVSQERFPIQLDPSLALKGLMTFTLLLLVVAYLVSKNHPLLAALLMFIPTLSVLGASRAWNALISLADLPFKPRPYPGINLVTSLAPKRGDAMQILLVAHYDSKSQSLSLVRRSLLIISLILLCLIVAFLYLSASHPNLTIFPPPTRNEIGFLSAVTALCALMIYKNKTFDTSPGALDDASGVGILLALAEAMKDQPPPRVRVTFLITDAEEDGLLGAWSYIKSHSAELSSGITYVLNLDGVGLAGKLKLLGKWRSNLTAKVLQVARERGIPLTPCFSLPGVLVDHIPFRWRGLEAITLCCLSSKSFYIHTPKDRPDLLEEGGLREVGELALAFIHEVDRAGSVLPQGGKGSGGRRTTGRRGLLEEFRDCKNLL